MATASERPAAGPQDRPLADGGHQLSGDVTGAEEPARVLVPRGGSWGRRICGLIDALSVKSGVAATGWVVPMIEMVPAPPEPLEQAALRVQSGSYDWIAVTSAAAAPALAGWQLPGATRVAAVGSATARALVDIGWQVDLTPPEATAASLVSVWPGEPGQRVLLPHSNLAHGTLRRGLIDLGCAVTGVTAYLTRAATLTRADIARLASGEAAAALITSGSVARSLAAVPVHPATAIVCLGHQTAEDARAAGLTVAATAPTPSMMDLVRCVLDHLDTTHRRNLC